MKDPKSTYKRLAQRAFERLNQIPDKSSDVYKRTEKKMLKYIKKVEEAK